MRAASAASARVQTRGGVDARQWRDPLVTLGRRGVPGRQFRSCFSADSTSCWQVQGAPIPNKRRTRMFKFLGKTAGFIFLIGLIVVIGLLMLIF